MFSLISLNNRAQDTFQDHAGKIALTSAIVTLVATLLIYNFYGGPGSFLPASVDAGHITSAIAVLFLLDTIRYTLAYFKRPPDHSPLQESLLDRTTLIAYHFRPDKNTSPKDFAQIINSYLGLGYLVKMTRSDKEDPNIYYGLVRERAPNPDGSDNYMVNFELIKNKMDLATISTLEDLPLTFAPQDYGDTPQPRYTIIEVVKVLENNRFRNPHLNEVFNEERIPKRS